MYRTEYVKRTGKKQKNYFDRIYRILKDIKLVFKCGAGGEELLAREIGVKTQDIQSLKPYEAYIGIGGKTLMVLTFQGPDISPYKTKSVVKPLEVDFLGENWMELKFNDGV